ncbi:MAG: xanthine dehydrogenase [Acidiferrobacteraceae bacterium]|nr:xanthine dehydrogenase [Acidiferrobacteraceae bacterium]|tara:strand:+ start:23662 stop:25980 length:2319 start_codon:yes stop_codon:yes gene_type:complete
MTWSGSKLKRSRDPVQLRGEASFVADISAGSKSVRFVRSPFASGRIVNVELPPEGLIFTALDIEDVKPICPVLNRPDYISVDQPILAGDRVTYLGEPMAAVVADSLEEAEDLAEQVFFDIEPEDPILTIDRALEEGVAPVHPEANTNVLVDGRMQTKNFDSTFEEAAEVIEIDIRSNRQAAMPLEARGGYAEFDRRVGRITLTASVQMPHVLRTGLADSLEIPERLIRVIAPDVGGGFGQKLSLIPEYVMLVWLSRYLKGSVRWIEDRRENLMSSAHSRDQQHKIRAAFNRNAELLAIDADIRCNVGSYSVYPVTYGVEPLMAMVEIPGPYNFQEISVRARAISTNTCPMSPYRGVSRPSIIFTMERLMDTAAQRFGIEPTEIRLRNLITEFPYRSVTGLEYDEGSYKESLERMMTEINLEEFRAKQQKERALGNYLGVGFSVFNERTGYGTPAFAARSMEITPGYETVEISMDPSGGVDLRIGASPHGQGLETTLSQLVADELGINPNEIQVIHGDTDLTPYGWGTFASRSLVISGGASVLAARKLKKRIKYAASEILKVPETDLVVEDGVVKLAKEGSSVGLKEIARLYYHKKHMFVTEDGDVLTARATYDPPGTFSNACHAAIVEVDVETGHVNIERYVVVEDAGRLINPKIVDGQVRGGVAQGIGGALYEEICYAEDGNLMTASLLDFLPPTVTEIPHIEIIHLETITDSSITGAKGLGEGGAMGAPAAVINAVSDALRSFNVNPMEAPMTPKRIRDLLRKAGEKSGS